MNDVATLNCQNAGHALRLFHIARDQGLRATYFPIGGTDDAHDERIVHVLGIQGDPQKINDFVRNYGR